MKPHSRTVVRRLNLFKAQFSQILNPDHPLLILAEKIDWKRFDLAWGLASVQTLESRRSLPG